MKLLLKPVPNREAIAFLRDKPPVARGIFDRLLPEVQARMFTVAGIQPVNVLQSLRDRIADLPAGGDWNAIKKDLVSEISPFLGTDEDSLAAAERKAELLLRTHGYQCYSATAYEAIQQQRDVFPFLRYVTSQDDRVRPSHAILDGIVLPIDDPFWLTHWAPWDWGCRCPHPVPVSRTDYAEIAAEDQGKPADLRSILSPEQRDTMNRSGFLIRGPNANVDVRPPRDKGQPGAWNWQPSDLRLSIDDLKKRYDAPTWSAFETFARGARLDPSEGASATVWDWLEGKGNTGVTTSAAGALATAARVVLPPEEIAPATPNKAPVSDALENQVTGPTGKAVATGLALIDKAHDDGALPRIPITREVPGRANGVYVSKASGRPVRIGVSTAGTNKIMTTTHEVGHFIDHHALDVAGRFASESSPLLAAWRRVVRESAAFRAIEEQLAIATPQTRRWFEYIADPTELWARAYAQYIATRTGNAAMLAEIATIRALPKVGPLLQWTAEEFAPIAREIDEVFRLKGWIK